MKIIYTLIKDIPQGTKIDVNDFYYYFNKEVVLINDIEKDFWNSLPNKQDILKTWFQQDVIGNRQLRDALLHASLNKPITFNMGDEFTQMDDKQRTECLNFMKTIKFQPNETPTTLVKM